MGRCEKLKWNRKRLNMSQKEFAEKVGLSVGTISKLENDENSWLTVRNSTEDSIYEVLRNMASWKPDDKTVNFLRGDESADMDESEDEEITKEPVTEVKSEEVCDLEYQDRLTLKLLYSLYEEIKSVSTHEDFVHNIKMMKSILKQY